MPVDFLKFDFADVKPSVVNFLIVGMMAALFIVLAKYAANRWHVPGLTPLVNMI